jgi:hypothetical protein
MNVLCFLHRLVVLRWLARQSKSTASCLVGSGVALITPAARCGWPVIIANLLMMTKKCNLFFNSEHVQKKSRLIASCLLEQANSHDDSEESYCDVEPSVCRDDTQSTCLPPLGAIGASCVALRRTPTALRTYTSASSLRMHFELVEEPRAHQRKSYGSESRYLAPNPFAHLAPAACLFRCWTHAGEHSNELCKMSWTWLASITYCRLWDSASFKLKMNLWSLGEKLRLAFDIDWLGVDGIERRERVVSNAFVVLSNVRGQSRVHRHESAFVWSNKRDLLKEKSPETII